MKFKEIKDKEKYLKEHYIFTPVPKLTDKKRCDHCDNEFVVGDFKVEISYSSFTGKDDEEFIVCPNAPNCDGTLIDWMDC